MKCEKHGEQATICRFCDAETIERSQRGPCPECTTYAECELECRLHPSPSQDCSK
jgi:hypothetical protein